jgi:hypothetical protein
MRHTDLLKFSSIVASTYFSLDKLLTDGLRDLKHPASIPPPLSSKLIGCNSTAWISAIRMQDFNVAAITDI